MLKSRKLKSKIFNKKMRDKIVVLSCDEEGFLDKVAGPISVMAYEEVYDCVMKNNGIVMIDSDDDTREVQKLADYFMQEKRMEEELRLKEERLEAALVEEI